MRGTIHGKTIVLEQDPGLPDGLVVQVEIEESTAWLDRFEVKDGQHVVRGTNLQANDLADLVDQGLTDDDLLQRFPALSPDDLPAIRKYARVPSGLRRSFGAWAEYAEEVDEFVARTYQNR